MNQKKSVLVVGAGISGLMAANELQKNGIEVVVLDKARGAGGRMSTRRIDLNGKSVYFDHGAQYFTARNERFQQFVDEWQSKGVVKIWESRFVYSNGVPDDNGEPRYIGATGMNAIAKFLAENLTVYFNERVVKISQNGVWRVETDGGKDYVADAVLLTMPVPQALELLSASQVSIPNEAKAKLQPIAYHPCIALMSVFEGDQPVLPSGGMWLQGEPVAWMSDNFQKGISPVPTMTIHAGPKFSAEHWTESDATVEAIIMNAIKEWVDAKSVSTQVHRWRYSFAKSLHNEPCLVALCPEPLAFAGDGFVAPRVEGAALSGIAVAESLVKVLHA